MFTECFKCGKKITNPKTFCPYCGHSIGIQAQPQDAPQYIMIHGKKIKLQPIIDVLNEYHDEELAELVLLESCVNEGVEFELYEIPTFMYRIVEIHKEYYWDIIAAEESPIMFC